MTGWFRNISCISKEEERGLAAPSSWLGEGGGQKTLGFRWVGSLARMRAAAVTAGESSRGPLGGGACWPWAERALSPGGASVHRC